MIQPFTSLTFGDYVPRESQFYVVTPSDQIPPFQIKRPSNVHGIADIEVDAIPFGAGTPIDIVALLDAADPMEVVVLTDGTDLIIYKQQLPLTSDLAPGLYYVKVTDSVNTWYSRYLLRVQCGAIVPYPDLDGVEIDGDSMPLS